MLILTRKLGEVINIDDNIKIHVVSIQGKQVRIGIEAPEYLKVHRHEVYERIMEANKLSLANDNIGAIKGSMGLNQKPDGDKINNALSLKPKLTTEST